MQFTHVRSNAMMLYTKDIFRNAFTTRASSPRGTISDLYIPNFNFFPNPQFFSFLHIQKEFHCNILPIYNTTKQHIFGKRDNSLLLGINYQRR